MKRKFTKDIILNIIASGAPTIVLQLILYPLIALETTSDSYGEMISFIAWINLSAISMGSVLNNTRLIKNDLYRSDKVSGDFNILLIYYSIINQIVVICGLIFLSESIGFINLLLLVVFSAILLVKSYIIVEFRLKLNFINILLDSVFMMIGYFIGYLIFTMIGYWEIMFLSGSLLSLIFVLAKTEKVKEPYRKTKYYRKTKRTANSLFLSVAINSLTVQLDKIILLPLLGAHAVTIYYVGTLLGKLFGLVFSPINSVILSYLSKIKHPDKNIFIQALTFSIFIGVIFYALIIYLSDYILSFIYPTYVDESIKYVGITTATSILISINGILNSFLLKFKNVKWQVIINIGYLVQFLVMSIIFLKLYGLIGFCYGILISVITKMIVTIFVFMFTPNLNNGRSEI